VSAAGRQKKRRVLEFARRAGFSIIDFTEIAN
jgi:hypothetical protein